MKKIILLIVLFFIFTVNTMSQIQSTTVGGYWNSSLTWVGGIIPGAADDVIIVGPVVHASASGYNILTEYCHNLTVTSAGSLRNGEYGGGSGIYPLVVSGNVINNGIVEDDISGDWLKISIEGNLENNNIWMPSHTEFKGSGNHNLSLAPGRSFGSKITNENATITALTDMLFTCDYQSYNGIVYKDHFYLNGHTFNVGNHKLEMRDCLINSGTLSGDFEILGTFKIGYDVNDTLIFSGNITVKDTLMANDYGGGYGIYKLKIIGNLTNNGVIKDNVDTKSILNPDDLNIMITGNINNNGKWTCNYVNLIGTSTQYITQSPGKQFDCYFYDLNAGSKIQAQSDITFTKDFVLNGATLEMENHVLSINGWLSQGFINKARLNGGFLKSITSLSNLVIVGKVTIESNNNIFQGSVVVEDTLQSNEYGGGSTIYTLLIDGDITNNGVIKNISSDDMLSLEIKGNINNNGIWQNSFTKFKGLQDQTIYQSIGKVFQTDFTDLDSTSKVIVLSDIKIAGNFNLNRTTVQMNNHEIDVSQNLYNGYLLSPKIKNGILNNIKAYDDIEIRGIVIIESDNYFYGNMVVKDTLQSKAYGGGATIYTLWNYGNVENRGLIRNDPTENEAFAIYIQGDIINKGTWTNYQVNQLYYLNHSTNYISCFNNSTTNCLFNGSGITGSGASSYAIVSGGGIQTITPGHSYDLSVQFNPGAGDTTAVLAIDCNEIGTLENIYLIGHNYNTTVDIKEEELNSFLPTEFVLNQNYPNPFNPSTIIRWQVPFGSRQTLRVFDIMGNEIATLVDEYRSAGSYEIRFNTSSTRYNLASGVYFYQLKSGDYIQTKKMIFMK